MATGPTSHALKLRLISRLSTRQFWSCQRRYATTISPSDSYGATCLQDRSLIQLRGPNAAHFLHGLTTANIPSSSDTHGPTYSAFLNAKGRLYFDVFIYPRTHAILLDSSHRDKWSPENEQVFLIDVDVEYRDELVKWLANHKLRSKVNIERMPGASISVYASWPPESENQSVDPRAPGFATRFVASPSSQSQNSITTETSGEDYKIRRYLFGIPEGQKELTYGAGLVHDSNIDLMGGVDFRKGCYKGQELVIRTQHTGVVRKRILPCVLYREGEQAPEKLEYSDRDITIPPHGANIKAVSDTSSKTRPKGSWIVGIGNVGLATCRLEDMAGIGPDGEDLPGYEEKEWAFEWEGQSEADKNIRLKPFVPNWWRDRIRKTKITEHGVAI